MISASNFNLRKNIVLFSVIMIITLIFMFFIAPIFAHASAVDQINEVFRVMSINGAKDALGLDGPVYDAVHTFAEPIGKVMAGIGCTVITALMIVEIIKTTLYGDASMEMWLKICVKIALGIALIVYTVEILGMLDDIGIYIVDKIAEGGGNAAAITPDTGGIDESGSALSQTGFSVVGIGLISGFLVIYIKIISYALLIELGLRKIFAPIAVASIVTEGIRSPGMRFFKKYLAVYVKMAVIIACVALAGELCVTISQKGTSGTAIIDTTALAVNSVGYLLQCIIIMSSCIGLIKRGTQLAEEVLGV